MFRDYADGMVVRLNRVVSLEVWEVGWVPRSRLSSNSGWCGLYLCLWGSVLPTGVGYACGHGVCYFNWLRFCLCLFFPLVWVVLVTIGSVDDAEVGYL